MKKVVFGCLGAAVLFAVAAGFAGYYLVYKPGKAFLQETAKFQEIPKLEANVQNRATFNPPAGGELTKAQLDRLLQVQESVVAKLGARAKQLEAKLKALDERPGGPKASLGELVSALKDLGSLVLDAKKFQVEALNQQKFSVAEYEWVRSEAYRASGIPLNLEISNAIRAAAEGRPPTTPVNVERATDAAPARNRELVTPHVETLRRNAVLAFFGL